MKAYSIGVNNEQITFIKQFKTLGFESENDLVNSALNLLKKEIQNQSQSILAQSADLYAEVYQEDEDLKFLTNSALQNWE